MIKNSSRWFRFRCSVFRLDLVDECRGIVDVDVDDDGADERQHPCSGHGYRMRSLRKWSFLGR
jgi:hypothetical protein